MRVKLARRGYSIPLKSLVSYSQYIVANVVLGAENTDFLLFFEESSRSRVPKECNSVSDVSRIDSSPHKTPKCYAIPMEVPSEIANLGFPTVSICTFFYFLL